MITATVTGPSAWILVAAFALLCLWAVWTCRSLTHTRGLQERVRPERERPIDLAAERDAYLASCDRHEEAIALRRLVA